MKIYKILIVTFFIIFSSLTNIANAESLKFDTSTYEGEVKKGKAHGVGIFTFSDGSTYEGKVKNNKIHGKGKYTDAQGKTYEGKFKYGSLRTKIDKITEMIDNNFSSGASHVILANAEGEVNSYQGVREALTNSNIDVRIFGKSETKKHRRMGVVLAPSLKEAKDAASKITVVTK